MSKRTTKNCRFFISDKDISNVSALLGSTGSVIELGSYRFFALSPIRRHVVPFGPLLLELTPREDLHKSCVFQSMPPDDRRVSIFGLWQSLLSIKLQTNGDWPGFPKLSVCSSRMIDSTSMTQSQRSCTTASNHLNSKRGPHFESHHILRWFLTRHARVERSPTQQVTSVLENVCNVCYLCKGPTSSR